MGKRRMRRTALVAVVLGVGLGVSGPVQASFDFTVQELGGDVVVNGAGTLDLTDLTQEGSDPNVPFIYPSADILTAGAAGTLTGYSGVSGPAAFGPGSNFGEASAASGSLAGLGGREGSNIWVVVPEGYLSGSALSNAATFDDATFASIGLTPGTYVYTWGSGAHADSLTVQIGVPEPTTWAMLALGLGSLGFVGYRASRKSVPIAA